ncbi:metacaspase-1 [Trichomonascus vanleenenianus]|uniref:Ca(2+)-dependent cysteine protease MCA1 n=1 Tax=Trichomonascus vanleenenianus TaxID=2268995 RepID=UPI003EC985F7
MSYNYGGYDSGGNYYNGPPPSMSYGDDSSRAGGYPGAGGQTYHNSYGPPQGPPPSAFGGPPQGPPPGAYQNNYGPPQGPPPGSYGGYGDSNGYGAPPTGPRPSSYNGGGNGGFDRPPTQQQSFGVEGMHYRYSDCSGKRKALIVGINYIGSSNALRGCINDANAVASFLIDRYGYKKDDMVILTDDNRDPRSVPTKANIIRGMQWLVAGARTNDTLFFHYSGHGGQTEDLDGDEDDGYDEVIYPVDFKTAGHIVDDDMHEIMVRPLQEGVRLTALFDSCHSGSALDLPYVYSTEGKIKEPNLLKEGASGLLSAFGAYERGDLGTAVSSVTGFLRKATSGRSAEEKTRRTKTSPADVIMLSGCKDSQTSADSVNAGTATGAMSYSFISVLAQNPQQSYISLLNSMRQVMASRYSQRPQLSSSHPIDVNLRFIM